jgi:signal peptidase I
MMTDKTQTNTKTETVEKKEEGWFTSWPSLIFFCVLLPILFRSFFFSPFHIPSSSMKPTMLIGDYLFVDKTSYGYSKYSFPFAIKLADTRNESPIPERGDVVVFRPAPAPNIDFIKRVIGLPGDTVQVTRGLVYLNGKLIPRVAAGTFEETDEDGRTVTMDRYLETLPSGLSYYVLDDYAFGSNDNTPVFTVPADHFFMLGDNRDNSADSRTKTTGYVPRENLVGKAESIFVSSTSPLWKVWKWPSNFRDGRFIKDIQIEQ